MVEFLLLLLPVAAASGWWAARHSMEKEKEHCADRDPAYFRGLNYLLNEQPDKAIDIFIKLLEVDNETVETHLALGNLFRRRGEVDRAIRIHQNLIARPTLSREQRGLALLELGQDYMRAGLFDRAESLFNELVEMGLHRERALVNLKEIYQQEKDWERCLQVVRQLETVSGHGYPTEIASYYCEQAQDAVADGDTASAWSLTRRALEVDRNCARACLIQASLERAAGAWKNAAAIYRQVVQADPQLLLECLDALGECQRELGAQEELIEFLSELYRKDDDTRVMLALSDILRSERGLDAALNLVTAHVQKHADLLGLQRYIDYQRLASPQSPGAATLERLSAMVDSLVAKRAPYQCTRCGFTARHMHWQCPGCKGWGTVRPVSADVIEST